MEIPVIEGDTLWQIAKDYGPSGSIQKDLYELMKLNELKDGRIYPGQVLIVPIV
jgi:LysM repeat protein